MKYIKTYEQNIGEPQVGDYVICEEHEKGTNSLDIFLRTSIGQITDIETIYKENISQYNVAYDNVPKNFITLGFFTHHKYKYKRIMWKKEIKYWSKNKEDLEVYIDQNKYNL